MTKAMTGPMAQELTDVCAELNSYAADLEAVEYSIQAAIEDRDLEALIALRARKGAIPDIINAVAKQRDELTRLRQEAIQREAHEAYEAQFTDVPERQTFIDPLTGTQTVLVRAKM